MAITTSCTCGKSYRLKDELAGKRVRCTQCRAVFQVPEENVETDWEVVDDAAPAKSTQSAFRDTVAAPPRPKALPSPPDEAPPPPPKRKRRRRRSSDGESGGGFRISVSPGIISGLLAMIGAVVWFGLGLYFGWIFFYPPILFIIGLVVFIRALMGQEEE